MGTIADKLQGIADSKAAIKNALLNKGQSPTDVLSSYADNILAISGASSTDPYQGLRPDDWMEMPTTVNDDEIYMLFHLTPTDENLISFSLTCTGYYTVALGTMIGGVFVQSSDTTVASGAVYENSLNFADWGDETSDGFRQLMIKVSGTDVLTFSPAVHAKKTSPLSFKQWSIVEIKARLSGLTSFICGSSSTSSALTMLRFFSLLGQNYIISASNMFYNCISLRCVLEIDTSSVNNMSSFFRGCSALVYIPNIVTSIATSMSYMFYNCSSLREIPSLDTARVSNMSYMFAMANKLETIPSLDTSGVTNMSYMFYGCSALRYVPSLNTSNVTNMSNMFYNCGALPCVPWMSTANVTNMSYMFSGCSTVQCIPAINTQYVTTMTYMFYNCYSLRMLQDMDTSGVSTAFNSTYTGCNALQAVTFVATASWSTPQAISFANASLSRQAIVNLFHSLPTIAAARGITLTGNPGAAELTSADQSIATGKGWTLIL